MLSYCTVSNVGATGSVLFGCSDSDEKLRRFFPSLRSVLTTGGRAMFIDYWRNDEFERMQPDQQAATRFVEIGYAVERFHTFKTWQQVATQSRFRVLQFDNLRDQVLPGIAPLNASGCAILRSLEWSWALPFRCLLRNFLAHRRISASGVAVNVLPYAIAGGSIIYGYLELEAV